jgi:hypothetical protein
MILKCKPLGIEQTIRKAASLGLFVEKVQMTEEMWHDLFEGVVKDRRTQKPLPWHHKRELQFSSVPVEFGETGKDILVFAMITAGDKDTSSNPATHPAPTKKSKSKGKK